ncbi:unnamed protein product, partial [Mesorhabditis spiculigera]
MSDDSDFDDDTREMVMATIAGEKPKKRIKRETSKTSAADLLNSITSKRRNLHTKTIEHNKEERKRKATLAAPLHRIARDKIHGAVGFVELKKELSVWNPVVEERRVADQTIFHEDDHEIIKPMRAADKAAAFYARGPVNDLEREMAEAIGQSKFHLGNDVELTEGEREIIKAMDVKEAKHKLAQMRKTRALMSYKQAADARKAKIKSKKYHRIQKRQKRRQLIKEFEDLISRDPEAAKEKLRELDTQRVVERATLKHGKNNAFNKELMKYASHNKEALKLFEDHLRLGRELKSKHGADSDSDEQRGADDDTEAPKSLQQLIKESAEEAAADAAEKQSDEVNEKVKRAEARIGLAKLRSEKRREAEESLLRGAGQEIKKKDCFATDDTWEAVEEPSKLPTFPKRNKRQGEDPQQSAAAKPVASTAIAAAQDALNDDERSIYERAIKEIELEDLHDQIHEAEKNLFAAPTLKKKKTGKKGTAEEKPVDGMLDPKNFLKVETANLNQVSSEFMDRMDAFDEAQNEAISAAFADDDVMGDFDTEKGGLEEAEKEKDIDLSLPGWGSWTGPGVAPKKKKDNRFIIKGREVKRKDKSRAGLIISEKIESSITKFQPKDVPFPYSRMEDFEAAVRQPIGRDWNSAAAHIALVKPAVLYHSGRVIRPLNKKDVLHDSIVDEE